MTKSGNYIAIHEAAHAVAHYKYCHHHLGASIVPDPDKGTVGGARTEDLWAPEQLPGEIVGQLAGYVASVEAGEREASALNAAAGDLMEAREVIGALGEGDEESWLGVTNTFVRDNWKEIQAVAEELVTHKTLDETNY